MLGSIALVVCAFALVAGAVARLLRHKVASSRRASDARAAPGVQSSTQPAPSVPLDGAHQSDRDAQPPEWQGGDEVALIVDANDADDETYVKDRSEDSSVITCLWIDPRDVLAEEPVVAKARPLPPPPPAPARAATPRPAPQKLPSILELQRKAMAKESALDAASASPSAKAATVKAATPSKSASSVPMRAPASSVQPLARSRAPRATPEAQPAAPAPRQTPTSQTTPLKPASTGPAPLPRLPRLPR